MRIGGLASGMDIDALVEKLMQAERSPLNKLQQKKQTYEWQRDAYRGVNTKLKTFDTYIADNLVLKTMNTKTATSSNSDFVSATATGSATGNLSIEGVSKLAKAARAVSTEQINAISNTKLSDLGFAGTSISFKAIQSNGEMAKDATKIEYDSNTTVGQLISKINASNAGVSAVFENGRLSVTAKNAGENKNGAAEIQVTAGVEDFKKLGFSGLNSNGDLATDGSNAQFTVNGIATERSTNTFSLNGYNVTLKKTYNEGTTNAQFLQAAQQNEQYAKTNLRNFINTSATKYGVDLTQYTSLSGQYNAVKLAIDSDISTRNGVINNLTTNLNGLRNTTSNEDANVNIGQKYDGLSARAKELLGTAIPNDLPDNHADAAAYAELSALGQDLANVTDVHNKSTELNNEKNALTPIKDSKTQIENLYQSYQTSVNTRIEAENAPSTTNTSAPVMLTSTNNVDDMMNKIKEFVTTYNGLVKGLMDQTKESKYRDYTPLTTEQRKEMEENEIKLWEEKAKSGLLRNDPIIQNGLSNMRSLIYQSNPAIEDSRYNTLYSIGITTSRNYNEGGTLEIDETKLRKALEENPDAVEQLFKNSTGKKDDVVNGQTVDTRGYLVKLRESMKTLEINIEKKAGRSSMTDAQYTIGKGLMDTETRIKSWETKLKSIEDRYWKQFTEMESAINKANQQSSMFFSGQQ